MSPRPRQASDAEILMAAFGAIARVGPARVTLADVARDAGLTAAAVVQRFGSKRALLLAAAADAAQGHSYLFDGVRRAHRSPLAALLALADCMTIMGASADAVTHSLAFFQLDLNDAEFRGHADAGARHFEAGIRALLDDAVKARELRKCETRRLAHALHATLNGSILDWAIRREGPMAARVRRDLQTVLEPYLPRSRRSATASAI